MEAILNNLIKSIGWSIFHSLWQGAIVYILLLAIIGLFPKMTAKLKHNLAYIAMCIIFCGFGITFFSLFKLPVAQTAAKAGRLITYTADASPLMSFTRELQSKTEYLFPYLVALYAFGILFQLLILVMGYQKLRNLKQAARQTVPEEWQTIFNRMVLRMNLRRKIGFYLSEQVNVPLVIGYLKPIVLFPLALANQLDIQQVEAILIHELSHVRRNDYLLNLIKTGIETLLFFNPFIWLGSRFIHIEREHACDDLVLAFTGTPITYAHALLKLELLKDKVSPTLSMAATGNNQHLYQRIKRITDMKTNYMNAKQQFFAITLSIATIISLAWISPKETKAVARKADLVKKTVNHTIIQNIRFDMPKGRLQSAVPTEICTDTTKKKRKFKILAVDAQGNQQEYNSIKEMPDSLKNEVISETFMTKDNFTGLGNALNGLKIKFKALNKDSLGSVAVYSAVMPPIDFKAFKIEAADMIKQAKANASIQRAIAENISKVHSIEFKRQQAEISRNVAEEIKRSFELKGLTNEMREQIEKRKALQNSPEYKKLKEKFEKDLEKIEKKKGIKTSSNTNFNYNFQFSTDELPVEVIHFGEE